VIHSTLIFNTFVFLQLINEFNARKLEDGTASFCSFRLPPHFFFLFCSHRANIVAELNPFSGMSGSWIFSIFEHLTFSSFSSTPS
jgi:hypothetical protein